MTVAHTPSVADVLDDSGEERNPPAFPVQDRAAWQYPGMTLRDYFAGQALIGILSAPLGKLADLHGGESQQDWGAYVFADAMLAARATSKEASHG